MAKLTVEYGSQLVGVIAFFRASKIKPLRVRINFCFLLAPDHADAKHWLCLDVRVPDTSMMCRLKPSSNKLISFGEPRLDLGESANQDRPA